MMKASLAHLILASGSPRRDELLSEAGYVFEVIKPTVEELEDPSIEIKELTALNAKLKGEEVANNHPESVIVAADTLVLLDGVVFGKPADMTEAASMLERLNGKTHQVFTAVALMKRSTDQLIELSVTTEVSFKTLSLTEQRKYHAVIEPLDKAGAYAAQDHGEMIIEKFSGSMSNVIGLPMDETSSALEKDFGIVPNRK